MSDSSSGVKQFGEEVIETTSEVAKDVKDEVGQIIEQGAQSVAGTQLTPQQLQQQKQEEQKKLTKVRNDIAWYKNIDEEQKRVREQLKQKEMQRLQSQKEEKEVEEIKEVKKKQQPVNPALAFVGKPEKKGGVGG